MSATAIRSYSLSAIVEPKDSPQLRVSELSHTNFDSLLEAHPAAITITRKGTLDAERLWEEFLEKSELFQPLYNASATSMRWSLYVMVEGRSDFEFLKFVMRHELRSPNTIVLLGAAFSDAHTSAAALVPEFAWTSKLKNGLRRAFTRALRPQRLPGTLNISVTDSDSIPSEKTSAREQLLQYRRAMLEEAGSFSSEELATAAESTTSNASQFAADQRNAGRIFGVRFGQVWHYPKFQFDRERRPLPEMKNILTALSPDDQGWDRLQWFLEPSAWLQGRKPIDVWITDRGQVVEAANTERWNGRD
jgi:hypothetical protein